VKLGEGAGRRPPGTVNGSQHATGCDLKHAQYFQKKKAASVAFTRAPWQHVTSWFSAAASPSPAAALTAAMILSWTAKFFMPFAESNNALQA